MAYVRRTRRRELRLSRARRISSCRATTSRPEDAKEQAVLEALGAAGAQYLDEVAERANISERDALSALWRMAAAGRVSNDNFAPLRMFSDDRSAERALESVARRPSTRHDAAVRARLKSSLAGRWSLIRAAETPVVGADETRDLALKLLERHGILAREMLGTRIDAIFRGAKSRSRCAGSNTVARFGADGSCDRSPASSTRCPKPSRCCMPRAISSRRARSRSR